jgi:hypothetical protein
VKIFPAFSDMTKTELDDMKKRAHAEIKAAMAK